MQMVEIPLDQLEPHPHNANVMPEPMLAKLSGHIERTGRYPPLIVRPMQPEGAGGAREARRYQILDGHHRAEVLRRLGRPAARCVVWEVDDEEALLLLATLNRLEGQDDAKRRSQLVGKLAQRADLADLAAKLPEQLDQLKKLATLDRAVPVPRPPQPSEQMPQAVHFFLLPSQRRTLEARLRQIGGNREAALMKLTAGVLK